MVTYTYPRCTINVKDDSIQTNTQAYTPEPLHTAFCVIFAEQGPAFEPVIGASTDLMDTFGTGTFDPTSTYFNHASVVAKTAMQYGQTCIVRLVPEDAATSTLVLECTLTEGPITQYERASDGSIKIDAQGNQIVQTDASGNPVTVTGYTASWSTRPLASTETYNTVQSTSVTTTTGNSVYTFPVLGFTASSAGAYGNRRGFRLWYTNSVNQNIVEAIDSQLYRFQPIMLPAGVGGNVTIIQDIFTNNYQDFSFMQAGGPAIDPNTMQDMSLTSLLGNYQASGPNSLGDEIYVYSDNVKQIGTLIQQSAPSEFGSMNPYMINIIGGVDQNGNPYSNFVVAANTDDLLNSMNSIWLQGGSDGNTSLSNFDSMVSDYFTGDQITPLFDPYKNPITHFYDSGFSMTTKESILTFLGNRDDVYLQMTTFEYANANPPNTAAQDQSAGAALLANARTYLESEKYGTPTCRVSIDVQTGQLAAPSGYQSGWVSPTLHVLRLNASHFSGTIMNGVTAPRPFNEVNIFSKISWYNLTSAARQLMWNTCLNTMVYCNTNTLYYPSRITVYNNDTSLLSAELFEHIVCFTKKIVRNIFTYYVGDYTPVNQLKDQISETIQRRIFSAFNNLVKATVSVSQTAQDIQNGFSYTVTVNLKGDMPVREWNVIIDCSRESTSSSSSSSSTSTSSSSQGG